jgi:hypothetical protein
MQPTTSREWIKRRDNKAAELSLVKDKVGTPVDFSNEEVKC